MARAGPSRSQRSQREPQASQYQSQRPARGRRRAAEDDTDGDGDGEQEEGDMDLDLSATQARNDIDANLDKKANDLVRLVLFNEQKRVPLRRDDINKKVLGSNTRSFKTILEKAQKILRKTFAMELVELQARNYREEDPTQDLQNATGVKRKAAAAGSNTFILRSTLDEAIIEYAAQSDERLLEEEIAQDPDDDDDDDMPRNYGSVISWSTSDQLGALGLLHVILALILVNGRSINDVDLRANLKRLRISSSGTVPTSAQSTQKSLPIDTFLAQLTRQGYIDRLRIGDNKVAGGKRGRISTTQANADDTAPYEWRWASRAHSEIGEKAIVAFVAEFMVGRATEDEDEDEDEDDRPARGRGKRNPKQDVGKKLEMTIKAIERAAGGNLADIK